MLGSNDEVIGLVKRSVWYMTVDLEKIFLPNVDFLRSCGVTTEGIRVFLHNYPRCLLLKPDLMRKAVERATEMEVDQRSKTFVHAVRAIASRSKQSLELKMQGFRDMGVSESEILVMFRRAPTAFCISLDKMKEIKSLLLATGRYEMCDLILYIKGRFICFSITSNKNLSFNLLMSLITRLIIYKINRF